MDSRLITGATSAFKLAGQQRRSWCDGDGHEVGKDTGRLVGARLRREAEVMEGGGG